MLFTVGFFATTFIPFYTFLPSFLLLQTLGDSVVVFVFILLFVDSIHSLLFYLHSFYHPFPFILPGPSSHPHSSIWIRCMVCVCSTCSRLGPLLFLPFHHHTFPTIFLCCLPPLFPLPLFSPHKFGCPHHRRTFPAILHYLPPHYHLPFYHNLLPPHFMPFTDQYIHFILYHISISHLPTCASLPPYIHVPYFITPSLSTGIPPFRHFLLHFPYTTIWIPQVLCSGSFHYTLPVDCSGVVGGQLIVETPRFIYLD